MNNFSDKNVLVTGCSSGIGLEVAKTLSSRGFEVFAGFREISQASVLDGHAAVPVELDLDNSRSIETAVEFILSKSNGRLYGLINNAAYGQPGAVEDLPRAALEKQFSTNVFGTQELTNLVLPGMRNQNEGRIVQISSILGFICLRFRGAYNASKYALEALTDTMRLELAGTGIHLSLIEPGPVRSDFRKNALNHFLANIDAENSPYSTTYDRVLGRLQSLEEARFTLPESAVCDVCLHALTHKKPKIRYRVTVPTKIMAPLKRLLPDRLMDQVLLKSGDSDE
ncbi:MAG: SDR family NAD(P)-dependent oxidoreductase [Pseudomonadota bacterium]